LAEIEKQTDMETRILEAANDQATSSCLQNMRDIDSLFKSLDDSNMKTSKLTRIIKLQVNFTRLLLMNLEDLKVMSRGGSLTSIPSIADVSSVLKQAID